MDKPSLYKNIGRLFCDPNSSQMSVVVDVVCEAGKYKYMYFILERGEMHKAFVSWFDDSDLVKWLTPPR